ncbi:MAG: glycosyltransferase family 4 protein [Actinomycetota bacterium]
MTSSNHWEERQSCLPVSELARNMIDHGVRRIHVLAWRDLADSESGGSEIHADHFMRRWQEAGLEVLHRTSFARARPSMDTRHGYRVIRKGSRLGVFPRTIAAEVTHRMGPYDAVVEIWNGMPWLTPLWCRKPRLVVLHHVHDKMWDQILPGPAAWLGRRLETSWAPRVYRRTETVTLCDDSRGDLLRLGWPASRLHVAPAGVDPFFSPGGDKTPHPSILAVGRLAPVKRTISLLEQLEPVHREMPDMRFTIVGDGPLRPIVESWIELHRAHDWVRLSGRVDDETLRDLYRESWLITSASLAEGWGLTLTEAAGCGTPAVATDIGGHRSAVRDGLTGSLVPLERLGERSHQLLKDHHSRSLMGERAVNWAQSLSWDILASHVLKPLHDEIVLGS